MLTKFQLTNGLKVLMIESHKSPVLSVQMWVQTGSADETKGIEGISHFIEHLVFKGTEQFGVGQIASTVEGAGGEINAYTSFDQTVFYVTLSKEFSSTGLRVIREMMGFPKFDPKEIDAEREVVIEEIKRSFDSPHREASRLMFSSVYTQHSYGIPVIGYDKNIRKLTPKQIRAYYESRYVPSNMFLVVAGDFDPKQMKKDIKLEFGGFKPFKLKKVIRKKEPKQIKPRVVVKKSKFEESYLYAAWKIPKPLHADIAALEILALILGQGESSRLVQRLRIQQPITNSVGSGLYTPKDGGIFIISAALNHKNLEAFLSGLSEEIQNIFSQPPTLEELKKALTNFESEELYSLETVDGLARKYGHYQDLTSDPLYFKTFMKQVREVTPEKIVSVAKKYLSPAQLTVTYLSKSNEATGKKSITKWVKSYWPKKFPRIPLKKNTGKLKNTFKWSPKQDHPNIERVTFKNGITLLLRKSSEAPTVSVRIAARGGLRSEPADKSGLVELTSNTWTTGTAELSEAALSQKVEGMAANLSSFAGRNSLGLSMELLSPIQGEASRIFSDVLLNPTFSSGAIDREKIVTLENIKARQDNPSHLAVQQFLSKLFKSHPYSRDMLGTAESVSMIERAHVLDFWKNSMASKNLIASISGDFDKNTWLEVFKHIDERLARGSIFDQLFTHEEIKSEERAFKSLSKEQSHVILGFKGLTFQDPRRYALQILQSVLAGQGGRLFVELRDKASLAYTVAPLRMEGIDTGYFGAYIGCSPEKVDTAIRMLKEEFEKVQQDLIPVEELARAKNYLIGRHDIDLQRNSSFAASMLFDEMYGLGYDDFLKFAENIKAITSQQVREVAQSILSQPAVISVVGKQRPKNWDS